MKAKIKRAIALVLTVCMLCSLCYVPGLAAEEDSNMVMSAVFMNENFEEITTATVGDIVYLAIKLENYVPIKNFDWSISYDKEILDYQEYYEDEGHLFIEGCYFPGRLMQPTFLPPYDDVGEGLLELAFAYKTGVAKNYAVDSNNVTAYFAFEVKNTGTAEIVFNTETIEGSRVIWTIEGSDGNAIPTTLNPGQLVVLSEGVSIAASEVTVDGENDSTVKATAINSNGEDASSTVTWTVTDSEGNPTDAVTVAADGTITVDADAAEGEYIVSASGADFGEGASSVTITVKRAASALAGVTITPTEASLEKPYLGAEAVSASFTAEGYDQYGDAYTPDMFAWGVTDADGNAVFDGISVSDDMLTKTLTVSVDSSWAAGSYTVTATLGNSVIGMYSASAVLTVTAEDSVAQSVTILKDGEDAGDKEEVVIGDEDKTISYTISCLDQYGAEMGGSSIGLSVPSQLEGYVSMDEIGVITVKAGAPCGTVWLNVNNGECSDDIEIVIIGLYGYTMSQPEDVTISYTEDTSLSVVAAHDYAVVSYQWMLANGTDPDAEGFSSSPVAGQTGDIFNIYGPDAGTYYYFCAVTFERDGESITVNSDVATVTVNPMAITSGMVSVINPSYTGYTKTPTVETIAALVGNYTVSVEPQTAVGNYSLTVTASGNYSGSLELDWRILPAQLTEVTDDQTMTLYIGNTYPVDMPAFTATTVDGSQVSVSYGSDYDSVMVNGNGLELISGAKAGDVFTVVVYISAPNHETVTRNISVTVSEKSEVAVGGMETVDSAPATYDGSEHSLDEFISEATADGEGEITYTVYDENGDRIGSAGSLEELGIIDAGEYTVVAEYEDESSVGSKSVTVSIAPASVSFSFDAIGDQTYNGTAIEPAYGGAWSSVLTPPVNGYTVEYSNNTDVGTATITITDVEGGNFAVVTSTATFRIVPKPVTISGISAADKTYDGSTAATITGTAVIDGLVAGDDVSVTMGTAAFNDPSVQFGTEVSFSGFALTGADAGNYVLSEQPSPVAAAIAAKAIDVVWGNSALTYTGLAQAPEASVETGIEGESVALTVSGQETKAGEGYTATAAMAGANGNYTLNNTTCTYSIAKAKLTLGSLSVSNKTYDGSAKAEVGIAFKGLVNGETLTEGTDYTVTASFSDANAGVDKAVSVTVTLLATETTENYDLAKTEYEGMASITPAEIDVSGVSFSAPDYTYDGGEKIVALSNVPENVAVSVKTGSDAAAQTNAGEYVTVFVLTSESANYTLAGETEIEAKWSIAKAEVAVPTAITGLVYTGSEQTGLADAAADALYTVSGNKGTDAGEYSATASLKDKANYAWEGRDSADRSISWSIAKASIDGLEASNPEQNSVVGVGSFAEPVFTDENGNAVSGSVTYSYNGLTDKEAIEAALKDLAKGEEAVIIYTFVAEGNHEGSVSGSLTISMVDIIFNIDGEAADAENAVSVKADATYGDSWDEIISVSEGIVASVDGETVEGEYKLYDGEGNEISGSDIPDAGSQSFAVKFFASEGDKYQGVEVCSGTVNVAKAKAEVKWGSTALSYNGKAQVPEASVSVEGLEISVSGEGTDAGDYTATATTENGNYELTNAEISFSIAPKAIDVVWGESALTYTGLAQAPEASVETGIEGESIALTVSGEGTAAGDYTATAAMASANGNYTLNNTTCTYSIAKAELTLGCLSVNNKTYDGSTEAEFGVDFNGLVNGETLTEGTDYTVIAEFEDANAGEDKAVSVTITLLDTDITANYDLAKTAYEGVASITPAKAAVIWGETSLKFNGGEQAPEAKAQGVNDEEIALVISGKGSDVGEYTATAATENGNYTLTNVSCGFSIVKAEAPVLTTEGALTVKFSNTTTQTIEISGVPADAGQVSYEISAVEGGIEFAAAPTVSEGIISYAISGAEANIDKTATVKVKVTMGNYESAEATAVIEIAAKDVPVASAQDITVDYSGSEIPASAIVGTAMFGEEVVAGQWSWVSDMSAIINAGRYSAEARFTPDDSVNYAEVSVNIAITISKLKVQVPEAVSDLVYNGSEQVGLADGEGYFVTGGSATNAGEYTANVSLDDAVNYEWASEFGGSIVWSIAKAATTGSPEYTAIRNGGKTLADASLSIGSITPADGSIAWVDANGNVLPDDTAVKSNTAYTWLYTPADTQNYEVLSGEIVLYVYRPAPVVPDEPELPEENEIVIDDDIPNGDVELGDGDDTAAPGEEVTIIVTPEPGYEVGDVTVSDEEGNELEVEDNGDGSYSFTMPEGKVNVSVSFVKRGLPFIDVHENDWFYDEVYFVYFDGLMLGVSDIEFAPKMNLTRGMMMTILARLSGEDTEGGSIWYEKGMNWAVENGVSDGTTPEANITREQVVTMIWRFMGEPEVGTDGLANFKDGEETSFWAVDAMNWAISVGLIEGDDVNCVNSRDFATRAEIAAIFTRLLTKVM